MCTVISSAVQRRVWRPQFAHTAHSAHTAPQSAQHTDIIIWICTLFRNNLVINKNQISFLKIMLQRNISKITPKKYSKKYHKLLQKAPKNMLKSVLKSTKIYSKKYQKVFHEISPPQSAHPSPRHHHRHRQHPAWSPGSLSDGTKPRLDCCWLLAGGSRWILE